jgi:hypothetical protein
VNTDLTDADLTGCRIYGISAWNLKLAGAKQQNLIITPENEPEITVDNIEVAQFIYLLLHNAKIRDVIDTIGKKGVLVLGRFTEGRMVVLERLRDKLRDLGFVPMVFNFDKPETKDFTETVRLLCGLSKFVIVDITNPRSSPLELQATVSDYMVPFIPILQKGDEENPFAMLVDLKNKHDWVLQPVIRYPTVDRLIEVLVFGPWTRDMAATFTQRGGSGPAPRGLVPEPGPALEREPRRRVVIARCSAWPRSPSRGAVPSMLRRGDGARHAGAMGMGRLRIGGST